MYLISTIFLFIIIHILSIIKYCQYIFVGWPTVEITGTLSLLSSGSSAAQLRPVSSRAARTFTCRFLKKAAECSNMIGIHGSLNVPIEHHPTNKGIWSTRWLLFLVSNIPKMGQLPTPAICLQYDWNMSQCMFVENAVKFVVGEC